MRVSAINIYPIKSLGGISLKEADAEVLGLKHDRRMMLIDEDGIFISQRKFNKLALMNCQIIKKTLVVSIDKNELEVPLNLNGSINNTQVSIWDDILNAEVFPESINRWFSGKLDKEVRLVKYGQNSNRVKSFNKDPKQCLVSFADGYPYLMIGSASMELLNSKLSEPLNIDRFRGNIIIDSDQAHIEDEFDSIKIGNAEFRNIKTCKRCIMTTIDQQSGIKGAEPLKTLSTYRKIDSHIHFGTNLICTKIGKIRIGDSIGF